MNHSAATLLATQSRCGRAYGPMCELLVLAGRHVGLALAQVGAVIYHFFRLFALDHAVNLDNQLVRKEALNDVGVDLDHVIFYKVELGLFLILNDLCLFSALVDPNVIAFSLVRELLVVDVRLLNLYVNLDPLA